MRPQSRSLTWPQSELEFPARPGLRGTGPADLSMGVTGGLLPIALSSPYFSIRILAGR